MSFGKFIEKTVKIAGIVSKVGIELGADLVGKVAEKVDDNPETREKYSKLGKKAGRTIKEHTSSAGKTAGEAVDNVVGKSIKLGKEITAMTAEAFEALSSKISELGTKPTTKEDFIENVSYDIIPTEKIPEQSSTKINHKPYDKSLELLIAGAFEGITREIDKTALEFQYKGVFGKKRERAISLDDYRQSLLRNTWYYSEMGPHMLSLLKSYLEDGSLPDFDEYFRKIESIQEEYKQKSRMMDFSRMLEDVEQLEFSYKYHSTYTDLLFMFVNMLTDKENIELQSEVVLYNPEDVVRLSKKYLDFSTNIALDNINFQF